MRLNPEIRARLHRAIYERRPRDEPYDAMMARLCPDGLEGANGQPQPLAPPMSHREGGAQLTLAALHQANIERQAAWCPDKQPSLSFRGNELAGETGEACNVIKKLERERHGWPGSRDTLEHLAEELADVVICADLCAITAGVDLSGAIVSKFNATSEKVGLPHRLPAHQVSGEA